MPQPPKPPMTLREAKRAFKRDGGPRFQYTASQMARADRLDARDEKRKKHLERERQRGENKRKREEKMDKERAARQKMLEEGRITVEDTWGKVTASQPRLNKFFGQKPDTVLAKGAVLGLGDQQDTRPHLHTDDFSITDALDRAEHENRGARQIARAPHRSPQSPLTQLKPSQLNGRAPSYPPSHDQRHTPSPASHSTVQQSSGSPRPVHGPPAGPHNTPRKTCSPPRQSAHRDCPLPPSASQPKQDSSMADRSCQFDDSDEEDFTDGIDDETFLMLCATQNPAAVTGECNTHGTMTGPNPALGQPETFVVAERGLDSEKPHIKGLAESFSATFNEIDEADLIALAEEVEADLMTARSLIGSQDVCNALGPGPTVMPPPVALMKTGSSDTQSSIPQIEAELGSNRRPPSPNRPDVQAVANPALARYPLEQATDRRKPVLPWDKMAAWEEKTTWGDFGAVGPSTQAMMVELAEQAEATLRR